MEELLMLLQLNHIDSKAEERAVGLSQPTLGSRTDYDFVSLASLPYIK